VITEKGVRLFLHYVSGIIVLISAYMIIYSWSNPGWESTAWILALLGWLPDFLYGVFDSDSDEE
jgi:hypothetical protein